MLFFGSNDFDDRRVREARRKAKRLQKRRAAAFRSLLAAFSLTVLTVSLWAIRRLYFFDGNAPKVLGDVSRSTQIDQAASGKISRNLRGRTAQQSEIRKAVDAADAVEARAEVASSAVRDEVSANETEKRFAPNFPAVTEIRSDKDGPTVSHLHQVKTIENTMSMENNTVGHGKTSPVELPLPNASKGRSDENKPILRAPALLKPASDPQSNGSTVRNDNDSQEQSDQSDDGAWDEDDEDEDSLMDEEGGRALIITLGTNEENEDYDEDGGEEKKSIASESDTGENG